ncbi:MAG: NADH:ubiquinone reductase (Na(+)-transporting) subunit B [Candidatus Hydrogenedentota bacterium]|nr:MAG: NADH:ubiquinone reductase (Na(+)-transporting) subunit B [Candidatus Hydrogenedentota bacterium]
MNFLREMLDKQHDLLFGKGKPLERLYPLYEANDTILFTPGEVTEGASHVRDGLDLKRLMFTVVIALGPCMLMAMYNTGYQAFTAIAAGAAPVDSWQTTVYEALGWGFDPGSIVLCMIYGALFYVPIYIVTMAVGGFWEVLFCIVRKHEITEGFLVTGALFPLILAPLVPLWQVALGISFGVVVAKEVFGGVGMNFLNPALAGRAFLFFAYPAQISGDKVWTAAQTAGVDGFSGATLLGRAALDGMEGIRTSGLTWMDAFIGRVPGSMGETSALFCIMGAGILIVTKIGSWRTIVSCIVGSGGMALLLSSIGSDTNPMFGIPFYWHWVLGGFAFSAVFMATDPVSSAFTDTGKLIYGFSIGVLGILIRVINPAYPEGWMLAILFMNMFAPLIDHFIVEANIKRRAARYATK